MIDIKLLRENPEMVKENIKKKFQDHKLVLVDEIIELDKESRELTLMCDELRMKRNSISKEIGTLMGQGKKEEAESKKNEVQEINEKLTANEGRETELKEEIKDMDSYVRQDMDDNNLKDEDIFRINEKIKDLEKQILNVIEG